jgi:hypothetical protein
MPDCPYACVIFVVSIPFYGSKCSERRDEIICLCAEITFAETDPSVPRLCCAGRGRIRYISCYILHRSFMTEA